MLRHVPWLLGLLLAPLMFGSVNPEGQAVVGICFGASLLLLIGEGEPLTRREYLALGCLAFVLFIGIIPLPAWLVGVLSPQTLALAKEFPIEPDKPARWLTLSLSPAGTMQRLWELSLVLVVFFLAQRAARENRFVKFFSLFVGVAVVLLAGSQVWFRLTGGTTVFGLWQFTWGKGAGTFANPNHFADWLYVGSLFCLGWAVRRIMPIQSARLKPAHRPRNYLDSGFLLFAALFGLTMAVASGSRGGFGAFLVGGMFWIVLVARRSSGENRKLIIGGAVLISFVLFLGAGGFLIERLAKTRADTQQRYSKLEIWRQSMRVFAHYPIFGTGWGSFVYAYNHYKTSGEDSTIWHAENDYVQQLVETGIVGTAVIGGLIFILLRKPVRMAWRELMEEPAVAFATLGALAVFFSHALLEFVFQITATAILAAALFGFLVGITRHRVVAIVAEPLGFTRIGLNLAVALLIIGVSICHLTSFWFWRMAINQLKSAPHHAVSLVEESLGYWPWASNRRIGLARAQARLLSQDTARQDAEQIQEIRKGLNRGLTWDPYNWELRWERLWLDLDFSRDQRRLQEDARAMIKLSPRQSRMPLLLAERMAAANPSLAIELLRQCDRTRQESLRSTLELAWRLEHSTPLLWSLAPDTVVGMTALGDFAVQQKLQPLAVQAFLRLTNHTDTVTAAGKLLEARRPDLVLELLPDSVASPAGKLLRLRAYYLERSFSNVVALSGQLIKESNLRQDVMGDARPFTGSLENARKDSQTRPDDQSSALRLVEAILAQPAPRRDLGLLREMANRFNQSNRIQWLAARAFADAGDNQTAAGFALGVAARAAAAR